jgi:hypothetical protein
MLRLMIDQLAVERLLFRQRVAHGPADARRQQAFTAAPPGALPSRRQLGPTGALDHLPRGVERRHLVLVGARGWMGQVGFAPDGGVERGQRRVGPVGRVALGLEPGQIGRRDGARNHPAGEGITLASPCR